MTTTNGKIQVAKAFQHLDAHHTLSDDISAGSFHRIGYKGKFWKLMTGGEVYSFVRADDGSPLPYLDVVIVGFPGYTSRTYYAGAYQEDSNNAPTCASLKGDVPDPGVPIPQHKTCGGCPHSQWKPNRGGQDCKQHKRVAVLLIPTMKTKPALPEPMLDPVFFKVPPASLKPWKTYTDWLQQQGAPYQSVITRISFNPDKQFEMAFDYFKSLSDADAKLVLPLLDDAKTKNLLGTMPEYKQLPPIQQQPPEDTGLAAAFAQQTSKTIEGEAKEVSLPAKRGRPRKTAEEKPADPPEQENTTAQEPAEAEGGTMFEEGQDDELDRMMKEVGIKEVGKTM
jgi:hypothetical protein